MCFYLCPSLGFCSLYVHNKTSTIFLGRSLPSRNSEKQQRKPSKASAPQAPCLLLGHGGRKEALRGSRRGFLHFLAVSSTQTVFVRRGRNAFAGSAAAAEGETKIICDHWLRFLCMCLCVCPVPSLSGKLHACLGWKRFMERAPWSQSLLKRPLHCP